MQQLTSMPACDKLETEHLQFKVSCALNTCLRTQQLIAVCLCVAASDWNRLLSARSWSWSCLTLKLTGASLGPSAWSILQHTVSGLNIVGMMTAIL